MACDRSASPAGARPSPATSGPQRGTRSKNLTELGWRRAENVPNLWLFTAPAKACRLLIIDDDLFFTEDRVLGQSVSHKLCSLLSAEYGDVRYNTNPSSFTRATRSTETAAAAARCSSLSEVISVWV